MEAVNNTEAVENTELVESPEAEATIDEIFKKLEAEKPKSNIAYVYRLYPDKEQCIMFSKTFGCSRKMYNELLFRKKKGYEETGKFPNIKVTEIKAEFPFMDEVDSLALCNARKHLDAAFKNHFDKKRKKVLGFPKAKKKGRCKNSYTTNNQHGTIALSENAVRLPKIGWVKAVIHRQPEEDWLIKTATVTQLPDGAYQVSVTFEYDKPVIERELDESTAIGLDYASDGLYVDSNGEKGSDHKYYRESEKKLKKAQRRLSRMQGAKPGQKPSNNYLKQKQKVAKIHRKIANQRKDDREKKTTQIANEHDFVFVETLSLQGIGNSRNHLGKSTYDNGFGAFCTRLEQKMEQRGKIFMKVDKWYPSSQLCSECGKKHPEMKDYRNHRTMVCECGNTMDRDHNAAVNILKEGLRLYKEQQSDNKQIG